MHDKKDLLVHICCAPCLAYPLEVLEDLRKGGGIGKLKGVFFNPNIHPANEFARRRDAVVEYTSQKNLDVDIYEDFDMNTWLRFQGEPDERCVMCYSVRMEKTAQLAAEGGFNAFTTTLLVSPYQKHELIRELGKEFARLYGVEFYYHDFREGFRRGQQLAREAGIYRQKYCGCALSLNT
jgi:predicted adenine nucleotide alpha hydrolase (AANH) superfamily ATPase